MSYTKISAFAFAQQVRYDATTAGASIGFDEAAEEAAVFVFRDDADSVMCYRHIGPFYEDDRGGVSSTSYTCIMNVPRY